MFKKTLQLISLFFIDLPLNYFLVILEGVYWKFDNVMKGNADIFCFEIQDKKRGICKIHIRKC